MKIFKNCLLCLLSASAANAVIFINETEEALKIVVRPKDFKLEQFNSVTGKSEQLILNSGHITLQTYASKEEPAYYDGSIAFLTISKKRNRVRQLRRRIFNEFNAAFSPEVTDYLFKRPDFQITLYFEKSQEESERPNLKIRPSIKEIEELAIKDVQTQAKPIIREAIKEIPSVNVKDIITEYYNPLEKNAE